MRYRNDNLIALLPFVLVAVMLDPRDAETRHSAAFHRPLPTGEFLEAEGIALACFVDGQESAGNRGDIFDQCVGAKPLSNSRRIGSPS